MTPRSRVGKRLLTSDVKHDDGALSLNVVTIAKTFEKMEMKEVLEKRLH